MEASMEKTKKIKKNIRQKKLFLNEKYFNLCFSVFFFQLYTHFGKLNFRSFCAKSDFSPLNYVFSVFIIFFNLTKKCFFIFSNEKKTT